MSSTPLGLFKDKDEVMAFLKNLGVEYRYGCYEEKNPEICQLLGEFVETIEQNIPKSTKLYKHACDTYNFGKSCHNYANSLFYGRGLDKNYTKALDYYQKACLQGYSASCFNAGQMQFNEHPEVRKSVPLDLEKAAILFEKGCILGSADACSFGTFLYHSRFLGTRGYDLKQYDLDKAFILSERGCALNEINSCNYQSVAYRDGLGCVKDEKKAKEAADKVKDMIDQLRKNPKINEMQRFT